MVAFAVGIDLETDDPKPPPTGRQGRLSPERRLAGGKFYQRYFRRPFRAPRLLHGFASYDENAEKPFVYKGSHRAQTASKNLASYEAWGPFALYGWMRLSSRVLSKEARNFCVQCVLSKEAKKKRALCVLWSSIITRVLTTFFLLSTIERKASALFPRARGHENE
jgi:hypothetical protein